MVRVERRQIEITLRGKPVAMVIPIEKLPVGQETSHEWDTLDRLTAETGARWPEVFLLRRR